MKKVVQGLTSGGLLGVWGKWVKHAKYIYNIQDFNPEQVLAVGYTKSKFVTDRKQMLIPRGFAHGYLTLEDDTLMQWCVDNDFYGEAAKAVRYDSDFVWEGDPWPEVEYIISEKDRNAVRLENFCGR